MGYAKGLHGGFAVGEEEGRDAQGRVQWLGTDERWALLAPLREAMLLVARRRCATEADAEDCVHEAMLRAATFERLDPARAKALLTSITMRLAVDMHRRRAREERYQPRLVQVPEQQVPPDEAALDAGEALWLAAQIQRLPERESAVLQQRMAGYTATETARRLSLSYKSVESAFTRARGRMRTWAGGGVLLVLEYPRRLRGRQQRPAVVLASLAMMSTSYVLLSTLHGPEASHAADATRGEPLLSPALAWRAATPGMAAASLGAGRTSHDPASSGPQLPSTTRTGTVQPTGPSGQTIFHTEVPEPPGQGGNKPLLAVDLTQYQDSTPLTAGRVTTCVTYTATTAGHSRTLGCPPPTTQ